MERVEHAWLDGSQGLSVPRALPMPFHHPTLEGSLKSALRDLAGALDRCRPEDLADPAGQ